MKRAPSHCVGIASARSGLRYSVHGVDLMRRCGGGAFTIQVKESSHLLHSSVPNTATRRMRLGARQTSVPQVGACVGPSRRIRRSKSERYLPRGTSEHPVIARQYELPRVLPLRSSAESKRERLISDLPTFHVKPTQHKRCTHVHARFGRRSPAACSCPQDQPAMLGTTPAPRTELLNFTPLEMTSNASSSSLTRDRRYLPG